MSDEVKYLDDAGTERLLRRLGGEWLKDYGENHYKHVIWRTYLNGAIVDEILEEDQPENLLYFKGVPEYSGENSTIDTVYALKDAYSGNTAKYAFLYCTYLKDVYLSMLDTSSLTTASSMFGDCTSLSSIDLSSWDTSSLTNASSMFYYCTSLSSIDLSLWDTSSLTNASSMFYYCISLSSIDLSSWDTSSLTDASYMFYYCTSLERITGKLDFSGITSYTTYFTNYAFRNCTSLTSVYISGLRTSLNLSYCPLTVECAAYLLEKLGDVYSSSYSTITFDADMQDEYEADSEFEVYATIAESNGWTITYA